MNQDPRICIAGVGAITPLGTAEMSVAAINAGISAYQQIELDGLEAEVVNIAQVPSPLLPELDDFLESDFADEDLTLLDDLNNLDARSLRILFALRHALVDLRGNNTLPPEKIPLILSLPEFNPQHPKLSSADILKGACRLDEQIDGSKSSTMSGGRAGVYYGIERAKQMLLAGMCTHVLVGGADSMLDMELLERLDQEKRLLGSGPNSGFAASEGAAVLLLSAVTEPQIDKPTVYLGNVGLGKEPGHKYSEENCMGSGLSTAVLAALSGVTTQIRTAVLSFNGEAHMAKEWGVAQIRHADFFADELEIMHPADCYGELGAAAGAMQLVFTYLNLLTGDLAGPCLVCSSSDLEPRGAVHVYS